MPSMRCANRGSAPNLPQVSGRSTKIPPPLPWPLSAQCDVLRALRVGWFGFPPRSLGPPCSACHAAPPPTRARVRPLSAPFCHGFAVAVDRILLERHQHKMNVAPLWVLRQLVVFQFEQLFKLGTMLQLKLHPTAYVDTLNVLIRGEPEHTK